MSFKQANIIQWIRRISKVIESMLKYISFVLNWKKIQNKSYGKY